MNLNATMVNVFMIAGDVMVLMNVEITVMN